MPWIILEGLDRSGKTTIAEVYKKRGFDIVHMSAPDKKFKDPNYAGPSYLDEIIDIYMKHNARDVIFDRSPYGEAVWPLIYGREARISEEDFEILRDIEDNNSVERYLMYDSDVEAHWKRCVDNKEPLTKNQFNSANVLFDRMATKHGFTKMQLNEFNGANFIAQVLTPEQKKKQAEDMKNVITVTNSSPDVKYDLPLDKLIAVKTPEQMKLDKANAINDILGKRIIKAKGEVYDDLEKDVRTFLNERLSRILGNVPKNENFSSEEIQKLKVLCKQIDKKMERPR